MTDERLTLTIPEASKRIGMSEPVIRRAIKEGKLPFLRLGERKLLIPIAALERFMANAGNQI